MILTSGLYAGHIVVILFACFQFIVNLDTWGGAGFSKRIEVGVSIYKVGGELSARGTN